MVRELWTLIGVELIDVQFVLVLLLGDSVSQGLVQSGLVDDVAAATAEVHGDVAVLVLLVELLELNRCLVVAAEALEAPLAAAADAVGPSSSRRARREASRTGLWLWLLLGRHWLLEDLVAFWFVLKAWCVHLLGLHGDLGLISCEAGLHAPDGLNGRWLLWTDLDSRSSGCKEAGTSHWCVVNCSKGR